MTTDPIVYAGKIYYYKNVIDDPSFVVDQIEQMNSSLSTSDPISPWAPWVAVDSEGSYVFGDIKQTRESNLATGSSESVSVYNSLKLALTLAGKDYAQKQGIEYIEPRALSISKYKTGAHMGAHVDDYGDKTTVPLMSAVLYLNDNYEGGELSFPDQEVVIKPTPGSIVIFPSVEPFYHQSMPILSGNKYMVPAFWIKTVK